MSDFFEFLNTLEKHEDDNKINHHREEIEDDYDDESTFEDDEDDFDTHQNQNHFDKDEFDEEDEEENFSRGKIEDDEEDDEEDEEIEDDKLDIIEKSLEYSKSVIKVIKENFNKKEQKVMLQTLRNTINLYLGDSEVVENRVFVAPVAESRNPTTESNIQHTPSVMTQVPSAHSGVKATMTEEEWNNFDTNQYDYTYDAKSNVPVEQLSIKNSTALNESKNRTYSKDLPLAVKVTAEGKREIDLSKISSRDVDDMKVLMGIK